MADSSSFKYKKADDSAGFLLWKITALWQSKLAEVLREFGITQTQYAILHDNDRNAYMFYHTRNNLFPLFFLLYLSHL